jgi:anti-sigma-K factor RskA
VRLRRADPHTLAGAYALDALPAADRAAFERHLGACDACRHEAASLREAAAGLASAAAAAPPQRLRERVLAQASRTRQLPPVTAGRPARRSLPRLAMPRAAVALAAVCLLVALGLGALAIGTQHRLSQDESRGTQIAAVLTAPDATMVSVRARAGGTATVVMSHARDALVLTTARLPGLPGGQRYEVWLMGPRGIRSAGMLPSPHRGMTAPVIVTGLAAGDRIRLTAEPAAGAAHPSSRPVLTLALPS